MLIYDIDFSLLLDENFRKLLPTLSEIEDAALGLIRLQTTYELTTQDLADGKPCASSSFPSYHQMTGLYILVMYNLYKYLFI